MIDYGVLKESDIPSLMQLYRQLVPDNSEFYEIPENKAETIWRDIQKFEIMYFAAKADDTVVGACYIAIIPNLTRKATPVGFIENVITDENYRRQGIGQKLMTMAVDYAKSKSCHKVVLFSGQQRTQAHEFYEHLGFDGDSKRGFMMWL